MHSGYYAISINSIFVIKKPFIVDGRWTVNYSVRRLCIDLCTTHGSVRYTCTVHTYTYTYVPMVLYMLEHVILWQSRDVLIYVGHICR